MKRNYFFAMRSKCASFVIVCAILIVPAIFADFACSEDGALDSDFGLNGMVNTDFSGVLDGIADIAIQADGKILAVGATGEDDTDTADIALARYNSDGSLDASFHVDGLLTTDLFGNQDAGSCVVVQEDEKIVVAGVSQAPLEPDNNNIFIVRYNNDGSLDPDFGTDGIVLTDFNGNDDAATDIAIQSDGKLIVVGGVQDVSDLNHLAILRYNYDGSLDPDFDSDGLAMANFSGGDDMATSVIIQPDGKIVVAGIYDNGWRSEDTRFLIVRFNSDGSLDNTFNSDGMVTYKYSTGHDIALSVAIQSDGKIIATGIGDFDSGDSFLLTVRYNSDGSIDSNFGSNGIVLSDTSSGEDVSLSVVIQTDGKIILAGASDLDYDADSASDMLLVRYNADGTIDDSFGLNGVITTDFDSGDDIATSIAIQSDGKVVVGGAMVNSGSDSNFAIARYSSGVSSTVNSGGGGSSGCFISSIF
jgi:uncharacterized delta-60 repeat protein